VNVQIDPLHCGTCAIACSTGQTCNAGSCTGTPTGHHLVGGAVQPGAGNAAATGGHAMQAGTIGTSAAAAQGAAGGHSISHGNVSQ
jgi:hypothetical protein